MFSGIRQLQLILLKVCLLLGVEVHTEVEFQGLIEPTGETGTPFNNCPHVVADLSTAYVHDTDTQLIQCLLDVFVKGWMAKLQPQSHPAATFQFDVFISAGGGRFVPHGETSPFGTAFCCE